MVLYRIDDELAFDQASVFVLGLVLFCLTILFLRDYHVLERYRYLIATVGILLLLAPFITRNPVNGAYLSVDIGPLSFQPAELAKICIVIFLASYLAEKREMLSVAARRVAGLTIPPLKHFGPAARRLGRGDADAGLHPRPRQLADVLRRLPRAALRRHRRASPTCSIGLADLRHRRLRDRLAASPTSTTGSTSGSTRSAPNAPEGAGQIQQSLFAQADGGLFGQGLGESLLKLPGPFAPDCEQPFPDCGSILPGAAHRLHLRRDRRWSSACSAPAALILIYALIAARGFKTAVMAPDGFSKLLAAGLTAVFALQAFVIIGGVTKVIPLTGVTLPFVSFGGSSVVANMILLALLLLISDRARRPPPDPLANDPVDLAGLPA